MALVKVEDEEKQKVTSLVEMALTQQGFELADVVLSRYKRNVTLRLFVYGRHGVKVADCVRLSHFVGDIIDGTDLFEGGYSLEVSSPGLDRPLRTVRDFRYRVGETVKVEFVDNSRKRIRAEIISADDTSVELAGDNGNVTVDLAEIKRATIVI